MDYLSSLDSLAEVVEKKTVEAICSQLKHLVDKGILKIAVGEKTFYHCKNTAAIEYKNAITLELKDKEYIESVEHQNDKLIGENKYLKNLINEMHSVASTKVT